MKTLLLVFMLLFLASCSSSEKVVVKDEPRKDNPYDESFDPNSLNDDDIAVHKFENSPNNNMEGDQKLSEANTDQIFSEAKGFRVQIIATKSIETATLAEQEARELFEGMNHKTYLIFEPPLYKIRVGDVTTRDDAEKIRDMAKDYGYREAFIVPTKVNVASDNPQ